MYGRANAKAFDANRWDYYVRDVYDAFYPGYWDMYPSLNGAIGMTFETDGGGTKGLRWLRDDGTIATLRSAIAKHFTASMTTLEVTAKNRAERLKDYYEFRSGGMADFAKGKMKRVVILPGKDRSRPGADRDIEPLQDEVKAATCRSHPHRHAYSHQMHRPRKTFPAGRTSSISASRSDLIKSILEPDTPPDKAFVDDNMAPGKTR